MNNNTRVNSYSKPITLGEHKALQEIKQNILHVTHNWSQVFIARYGIDEFVKLNNKYKLGL